MGPMRPLSPSNPLPCEIPPRLDKPTRLTAGTIAVTLLGIGISISISLFVLTRLGLLLWTYHLTDRVPEAS